nr:hypothetical protein [Aquabacterium sp.]
MAQRSPSLVDTLPNQVAVDRLMPDNQDTVILTRPFPDADSADSAASGARRARVDSLPTIGHIARYALK